MTTIHVETGCRLHFGLLSQPGTDHGRFAGVGMMLESPGVRLIALESMADGVIADKFTTAARDRVRTFMERFRESSPDAFPNCEILVDSAIPSHAGLGSGTQLGLATATAIERLSARQEFVSPWTLAEWVGRGRRSGIGIAGSRTGGLLLDSGEQQSGEHRVRRIAVPKSWRVVLITPLDETGLSGAAELRAFDELPPTSRSEVDRLWKLGTERLAPSVEHADFAAFSEAVYEYGFGVGQTFAAVQGGPFANSTTGAIVEFLRVSGVRGVGQTSWGPTVFAFAADRKSAGMIVESLHSQPHFGRLATHITRPRNTGMAITPADPRK
ncbi:GHMP family kinase ATP-binding protein [Thalassoroseus pseudoceratinae]|uniref:GHMP family kinase ATP-binding protein n=1 Tax=Thalassoroseus pseudoceratinae TaxID=2713176 RepID=UPI00141F81AC|nr:hypothetical protein [Thalassoroseus pseudoceratinae]